MGGIAMSEKNRELVELIIEEIFNRKRTGLVEILYAPYCYGHSPEGSFKNRAGFIALLERYVTAFPDFRLKTQLVIAEDDWVALHYNFVGTNSGPLVGFPATGQTLALSGFIVSRIANSRIIEQYFMWDNLNARQQLWQSLAA
jgi:steroid delta-isomerase-like uncharacterized protein